MMKYGIVKTLWFSMVLIILTSISLILLFPPFQIHYLSWFALVPLLFIIRNSGLLRSFMIPLAIGVLFYSFLIRWLFGTDGVNVVNYFLSVLLKASFFGILAAVPVLDGDTEESLTARILRQEHRVFPLALQLLAEGRLRIVGRRVLVDGRPPAPDTAALLNPRADA